MVQSVVLDALLLLILILLVPLGFYRGGLREVCSSAGLLLGLLIANEWAARWGDWIANRANVRLGICEFVVAVATLTLATMLVGYGAGAAFSYHPGPGGRLYGGLVSLLNGAVFLGSLMNFEARFLSNGTYPALVQDGFVSRGLSIGIDWVLLAAGVVVLLATSFGMIVRERDVDDYVIPAAYLAPPEPAVPHGPVQHAAVHTQADKIEPMPRTGPAVVEATSAIKVKEVRHWEEPAPPSATDLASGWQRTWPGSGGRGQLRPDSNIKQTRRTAPGAQPPSEPMDGSPDARIIRDWLAEDHGSPSGKEHRTQASDLDE